MGLRGELGRSDIRNPDLDRAEPLGAETLAMLADTLSHGNGGAAASHVPTLHVTTLWTATPCRPAIPDGKRAHCWLRLSDTPCDATRLVAFCDRLHATRAEESPASSRGFEPVFRDAISSAAPTSRAGRRRSQTPWRITGSRTAPRPQGPRHPDRRRRHHVAADQRQRLLPAIRRTGVARQALLQPYTIQVTAPSAMRIHA